jgi:flagellar hook-associated protein 2
MGNNAFSSRTATLSSNDIFPANSYLAVDVKNGAQKQTFDIEVKQLATSSIKQTRAFSSDSASAVTNSSIHNSNQFTAGTFKINGINITLGEGDSLRDVANIINSQNAQTKVTASITKPATGEYRLILKSDETGLANAFVLTDPTNVLNSLFVDPDPLDPEIVLQVPQDAILLAYGGNETITRPSNTITDYIDNVTFSLFKKNTPGSTVQVTITQDIQEAAATILEFTESYNAIIKFIANQQMRDSDGNFIMSEAKLGYDPLLDSIGYNIDFFINNVIKGLSTSYNTLYQIGINTGTLPEDIAAGQPEYKNILFIDEDKLIATLSNNFEAVRKIFEVDFYSSSSKFLQTSSRGNNLTVNSLTVDIDIARTTTDGNGNTVPDVVHVTYNPGTGPVTIKPTFTPNDSTDYTKGGRIAGLDNTILEGFVFRYIGNGTESFTVSITQGIADKIHNYLTSVDKSEAIETSQELLDDFNKKIAYDITKKNRSIEHERETLLLKFSALEAAFAEANSVLMYLDSQQQYATK